MYAHIWGFPGSSAGKESACNAGDPGLIPWSGRSHGEEMATHSSVLAWEISWTEEPGGLQPMVLQESDTKQQLNHHHHIALQMPILLYKFQLCSKEKIGECRS